MLILAHRGASADFPENTLPAFEGAVRQGADGVEFDVMPCASGEWVVCHDETLHRLANVDWVVRDTPYSKLATARILGKERIPLLKEVLEVLPRNFFINVELKCDTLTDDGLSVGVGEVLTRLGRAEQAVVSSFNPLNLLRLSRAYPALRRGYLLDPARSHGLHARVVAPLVANHAIHPHESACTPKRVARWKSKGWRVITWTVDSAARAAELSAMGVDALITNRPGALRAEGEARSRARG